MAADNHPAVTFSENTPELVFNGANDSIPIAKIIELRNKELTYSEIGAILGCTKENICIRLRPFRQSIDHIKSVKQNRADTLTVVSDSMLTSLTESDIKDMSGLQRVTAYGILYDKERLERDKSTQNIAYHNLEGSLDELQSQEAALRAELGLSLDEEE